MTLLGLPLLEAAQYAGVGLITGWLANLVFGREAPYGRLGDMVFGVAGGLVGGWVQASSGLALPFGPAWATLAAFAAAGAIAGLLVSRLLRAG